VPGLLLHKPFSLAANLQRPPKTAEQRASDSAGFAVHSTPRMSEPGLAASGFTVSELPHNVRHAKHTCGFRGTDRGNQTQRQRVLAGRLGLELGGVDLAEEAAQEPGELHGLAEVAGTLLDAALGVLERSTWGRARRAGGTSARPG
jgi:hypothetical protein